MKAGYIGLLGTNSTPIEENGVLIQLNIELLNRGASHLRFQKASVNEGNPNSNII